MQGEDLRIGGEGMKGFYDDMLPRFVSKYAKKWGAKVGEVTMPELQDGYQTMHAVDVTEPMKESVMHGLPMFSYVPSNDPTLTLQAATEMQQIRDKAIADGTFMKAPNGTPTNLDERAWLQVRTQAFKDWFGDWELAHKIVNIVSAVKEHGFANFAEARQWAKSNIVGEFDNKKIGKVNISGKAIEKYLSEKAVSKSADKDVHLSALRVMPQIIEQSLLAKYIMIEIMTPTFKILYAYLVVLI